MIIRDFYKDLAMATDCPAMAIFWSIQAIAEHQYLANRHHWTADRDTVVKNLKHNLHRDLEDFGSYYIFDKFEEMFRVFYV